MNRDYKGCAFQSLLAFACLTLLLSLYELFGGFIVASLGASSFILFVTPHAESARAKHLIAGYAFGAFSGVVFGLPRGWIAGLDFAGIQYVLIGMSAAAAALTVFLMAATKLAHPPSAALALGLSAGQQCVKTALAAIAGILILCAARRILKKHLKNLI